MNREINGALYAIVKDIEWMVDLSEQKRLIPFPLINETIGYL